MAKTKPQPFKRYCVKCAKILVLKSPQQFNHITGEPANFGRWECPDYKDLGWLRDNGHTYLVVIGQSENFIN